MASGEINRNQFTFYKSFATAIRRIKNAEHRALAYDLVCDYALTGALPDMDELPESVAIIIDMLAPVLESGRRKAESGRAGGESKAEANRKQTQANDKQIEANAKQDKDKDKGKDKDKFKKKENIKERKTTQPFFRAPTVEEVEEYINERGSNVDAHRFVDFYAAKGWMVGKNKMKDWKAAVRTWESRERKDEINDNAEDEYAGFQFGVLL